MSEEQIFRIQCNAGIEEQGKNEKLALMTRDWMNESIKTKYSYHFEWLGRPIIQYPQDIVGVQQLLWNIKPDLVIETGIARGGSLIFYASMLELIAQCGGSIDAKVVGVDIDIRDHNKREILAHPMSKRIEMIEGSSIDHEIFEKIKEKALGEKRVLVCLDSNHTHSHVLQELRLYSSLVTIGSYIVVFDTLIEDICSDLIEDRPWAKGNNPKTAVFAFLESLQSENVKGVDGLPVKFVVDKKIDNQLLITVASNGYLKRVR
jgi:cephalosporin hydroxylase